MTVKTQHRLSITTYRSPGYSLSEWRDENEPSFVNNLRYRKWRITAELVDEPLEVLQERLQKMWEQDTNWHHGSRYEAEAQALGFELQGRMGEKARG